MNKKIKWVCLLLILLLILAGCAGSPGASPGPTASATGSAQPSPSPQGTASPSPDAAPSKELVGLLPHEEDFQWHYSGFAEYGHEMTLDSIAPAPDEIHYTVSGRVYDMSDGESDNDFSISLTYTVDEQSLVQEKTAPMMLDSEYDQLELVRMPLQEGADWRQTVEDGSGQETTLDCTIEKTEEKPGGAVYTVLYQDTVSDYYERREIQEDNGVIRFEKLYMPEGEEPFPIGYSLYSDADAINAELSPYLPVLGKDLYYFGLAEYGHVGKLTLARESGREAVYTFDGIFQDGSGIESPFQVQYYVDYERGTVTEQVMSNDRTDEKEINSKLHNVVILTLPIEQGAAWSHQTAINGKQYTLHAEITEYEANTGFVRVRYTAKGVPGYHDETYLEERTFEYSYGMTTFQNIMPGEIAIREGETEEQAIANHMFGYSLQKEMTQ